MKPEFHIHTRIQQILKDHGWDTLSPTTGGSVYARETFRRHGGLPVVVSPVEVDEVYIDGWQRNKHKNNLPSAERVPYGETDIDSTDRHNLRVKPKQSHGISSRND